MSYYGGARGGKTARQKKQVALHAMPACIACIERPNLTCSYTEEERGKSHTRCDIGSEASKGITTQRGQNAVVYVVQEGEKSSRGGCCSPVEFPHLGADLCYSRVPKLHGFSTF